MLNKGVMDEIAAHAFPSQNNNDLLPEVLAGLVNQCIAVRVQHPHTAALMSLTQLIMSSLSAGPILLHSGMQYCPEVD